MEMPLRRMRVRYLPFHNPPIWEASYEPPGKFACYCHAKDLEEMMEKLGSYYAGKGTIRPLRIEERLARYLRSNERYVGIGKPAGSDSGN